MLLTITCLGEGVFPQQVMKPSVKPGVMREMNKNMQLFFYHFHEAKVICVLNCGGLHIQDGPARHSLTTLNANVCT